MLKSNFLSQKLSQRGMKKRHSPSALFYSRLFNFFRIQASRAREIQDRLIKNDRICRHQKVPSSEGKRSDFNYVQKSFIPALELLASEVAANSSARDEALQERVKVLKIKIKTKNKCSSHFPITQRWMKNN